MDTNEYERLATLYLDCIYRIALNGCQNYMDAEDVVQNTFMKLLEKEEYFADDAETHNHTEVVSKIVQHHAY